MDEPVMSEYHMNYMNFKCFKIYLERVACVIIIIYAKICIIFLNFYT